MKKKKYICKQSSAAMKQTFFEQILLSFSVGTSSVLGLGTYLDWIDTPEYRISKIVFFITFISYIIIRIAKWIKQKKTKNENND